MPAGNEDQRTGIRAARTHSSTEVMERRGDGDNRREMVHTESDILDKYKQNAMLHFLIKSLTLCVREVSVT